jgi:excisionase family DNA binding protein
MLNVKPLTIYGWIHRGLIDCHKFGRLVRLKESDVMNFVKQSYRKARTFKQRAEELSP